MFCPKCKMNFQQDIEMEEVNLIEFGEVNIREADVINHRRIWLCPHCAHVEELTEVVGDG